MNASTIKRISVAMLLGVLLGAITMEIAYQLLKRENRAPQEIEFACSAHPKVVAAIAVGRSDARLGQRIHALVVPRDASLRPAELRAFLRERLEKYKQPDVFYFARELPAGRTGKADRGRFAAMLEAGELAPQPEEARP